MNLDFLTHLSYSSISSYETCPRCWWLKYKYGYELPPSDAMDLGSEVHKAIESYHKDINYTPPEALKSLLTPYCELYLSNHYDEIEKPFKVILEHPLDTGEVLPIPFVGKIDRIWKNNIHDLKTSSRKYYDRDVNNKHQHNLYAYAYRQFSGNKEDKFIYDIIVKNKTPKIQILELNIDDNSIRNSLLWVWNVWSRMNILEMPKYHTPVCRNKDYLP